MLEDVSSLSPNEEELETPVFPIKGFPFLQPQGRVKDVFILAWKWK